MKNKGQNTADAQHINDLIMQAPVAISFLKGHELIIESANEHMLELWGRQHDIMGQPLALAMAGQDKQAYVKLLHDVYKSHHIHYGYETKVWLNRNDRDNLFYFDFVYKPVKDAANNVTGVMIIATEVTKQVIARQLLEDAEERLRLAIEATGIGTWELDMEEDTIFTSPTLTEILGLDPEEKVTRQQIYDIIHPDDKYIVTKAFEDAVKNGTYLYEARIIWPDGSIHWIRTSGKMMYDDHHKPLRMLGTTNDITERKQDEIMKNDFIAMASHELKTPLTSIKAYIQLLLASAKKRSDTFYISALEKSERQINKMTRLIHGFLDLSKIESGRLRLNTQDFDINILINEVIADSMPAAPGYNILFNAGTPIHVKADKEKISQVLGNLINNAVKYSANGSKVTITAKTEGVNLRVSIKDQGIGLKLKDQQKIFQRFFRVDDENARGQSGFGIGLYLSAEIIKLHHGSIGVESEEGKGSEFYFLLPL